MSFLAKLEIDGHEYNVLEFDIHLTQETDHNGRPQSIAEGGNIRLIIESTRETNFMRWMISNTETKDGKIIFYRRDALSKMKELDFEKGYCIEYHESFRSTGEVPMKIEMTVSCKTINFSGAELGKAWTFDI